MSTPERRLWHQVGVNDKGEAFVQLILEGKVIAQMSPQEAREHGQAMFEVAEAAEQDAFIVFWAQTRIGVGLAEAAKILQDFRDYRNITTAKRGGPPDPQDWIRP